MPKHPESPQVYEVMDLFKRRCLRSNGSLLWGDDSEIWTIDHVSALIRHFVEMPDESDRSFWEKLEEQLSGLPQACYKIMADAFIIYSLPSIHLRPETKWKYVTDMCRMGGITEPDHQPSIREALSQGFASTSQRYHRKYLQLWLILLFARELKQRPGLDTLLDDAGQMTALLDDCLNQFSRNDQAHDMRNALLHMLFPSKFERIISRGQKAQIVAAYEEYLPRDAREEPVDQQLFLIRQRLQAERNDEPVDFYAPEFRRQWLGKKPTSLRANHLDAESDETPPSDPLLEQLSRPLIETGQLILYGPPGTGKTYYARRLAETIIATNNFDKEDVSSLTPKERGMLRVDGARESQMAWWCVADPERWSWQGSPELDTIDFDYGRIQQNFHEAQVGDLVFGYEATPVLAVTALARVDKTLHRTNQGRVITLKRIALLDQPIPYQDIREHPVLEQSQPIRMSNRGTLFRIEPGEAQHLLELIRSRNPKVLDKLEAEPKPEVSYLRICTFHPAYGYEEFVEGYRPHPSEDGRPHFTIQDGIFKRLCRDARQQPDRTFVLIIDEINRGNIPRIFGELITLIERDKRWRPGDASSVSVELPISRESFAVPENVYIIATMNTADKSIAVLDTALRRRFAFRELMPEPEVLGGVEIDGIPLDGLLAALNERIVRALNRNLQIGHAYFMNDGQPITTPMALATVLRDKVLPLLQDYCYDDYAMLYEILGAGLVDPVGQRFHAEIMALGREPLLLERIGQLVNEEFANAATVSDRP